MPSIIDNLTSFADQTTTVQLQDGTTFDMELIYQGATQRWVMSISYGTLTINGINLCCYPNVLRQWKNLLPFGLACVTPNLTDPFDINDFANSRAVLYVLSQDEVNAVESTVFGTAA